MKIYYENMFQNISKNHCYKNEFGRQCLSNRGGLKVRRSPKIAIDFQRRSGSLHGIADPRLSPHAAGMACMRRRSVSRAAAAQRAQARPFSTGHDDACGGALASAHGGIRQGEDTPLRGSDAYVRKLHT